MRIIKCRLCGKELHVNSRQRYCGDRNIKETCAWKHRRYMSTQRNKRWREKNPERNRENDRRWKLNHPENKERERKKRKQSRLKLRFQALLRDNFTCQYCGRKAPEVEIQVDHRFPKSKGGLDKIENYITSCRDCNIGKGDSILEEFIK